MWVMELASPKYRSILSSSTVVSVPFASFLVACIILGVFDKDSDWAWRGVMLVSIPDTDFNYPGLTQFAKGEAVPSILSLCLLPLVDESPRWLFAKGRREEVITPKLPMTESQLNRVQGIDILARLHANGDRHNATIITEVQEILSALANEKQTDGGWKELITPCMRHTDPHFWICLCSDHSVQFQTSSDLASRY